MLDARKALFLRGGHDAAVHQQRGCRVVIEGRDAEDCRHAASLVFAGQYRRRLPAGTASSGGETSPSNGRRYSPVQLSGQCGDFLGRAGGDDLAARVAPFGPQVDDPVGRLDHVQIVLDHQHRVAQVDQPVEHGQQLLDVVEVQAGGRLVEDVERVAGVDAGQFGGQLDALGLAAGERGRGLAQRQVAQADFLQAGQQPRRSAGKFSKNSTASSTRMSSTSAIDWPR